MEGLQEDIDIIKSLIAITKGGLAVDKLHREYQDMTGSQLNYRKYGFQSIFQMLESSRDIVLSQTPEGTVCRVYDEKMSHVTELVEKTKKSRGGKKTKNKGYHAKSRPSYHTSSRRFSSPHTQQRAGYQKRGSFSPHCEPCHRPVQQYSKTQYQQHNYSMIPTQALASYSSGRSPMPNIQSVVVKPAVVTSASCSSRRSPTPNMQSAIKKPAVVKSASCSSRISPTPNIQSAIVKPAVVKPEEVHQRLQKNTQHQEKRDNSPLRTTVAFGAETESEKESSYDQASNQKVGGNKSVQYRLNLAIRKARVKEVLSRSDSGSDWSTDSVERAKSANSNSSSGWSSSSLEKSPNLRRVHVKGKETVFNSKMHSEVASRYTKVSNLTITVRNITGAQNCNVLSDSDWSSDLESPPSHKELNRKAPPVLDTGSSTSFTSPPLMIVRGRGRGRLRNQEIVMTPGFRDDGVHSKDASHSQQDVTVVSGTPNKREALTSSNNGHSSILVKVANGRAVQNVQKSSVVTDPSYGGYQFVGDYFLLRVAEVSLGSKIVKEGPVSICGLCRSNLTISDCEKELINHGVSEKIVLMIGMTDILQGATILEMRSRMTSLIQRISHLQLVILSLPVPPSFIKAANEKKLCVLEAFNKWILQLPWKVIDIDCHLYSDAPFYMRTPGNEFETFSEEGSLVVIDEIISAINHTSRG